MNIEMKNENVKKCKVTKKSFTGCAVAKGLSGILRSDKTVPDIVLKRV